MSRDKATTAGEKVQHESTEWVEGKNEKNAEDAGAKRKDGTEERLGERTPRSLLMTESRSRVSAPALFALVLLFSFMAAFGLLAAFLIIADRSSGQFALSRQSSISKFARVSRRPLGRALAWCACTRGVRCTAHKEGGCVCVCVRATYPLASSMRARKAREWAGAVGAPSSRLRDRRAGATAGVCGVFGVRVGRWLARSLAPSLGRSSPCCCGEGGRADAR